MDKTAGKMISREWSDQEEGLPKSNDDLIVAEATQFETEDTERLRAEIEDTRAEMGQTINEITERLSPDNIMEQVKESVRDATIGKVERAMQNVGEKISNATEPAVEAMGRAGTAIRQTSSSIADSVQRNPIPVALIGLGVGMLAVKTLRNRSDAGDARIGYGASTRSADVRSSINSANEFDGTRSQAEGTFDQLKNTGTEVAQRTTRVVSQLGDQAKEGALRVSYEFRRLLRENPLAVAAAAIAVGATVGLALPRTSVEADYMGEASEKLVDKAQQIARDAMDQVQSVTQETTSSPRGRSRASSA